MKKSYIFLSIGILIIIGVIFLILQMEAPINGRGTSNKFETPDTISSYKLATYKNLGDECIGVQMDDMIKRICAENYRAEYYFNNSGNNYGIYVFPMNILKEKEIYLKEFHRLRDKFEISPGVFRDSTENNLHWYSNEHDIIRVHQYIFQDGMTTPSSVDNPVIAYYLEKYPPIK